MPGQIKHLIDTIVAQRAKGNHTIELTTRTKLVLKGIDPAKYTALSPDDPAVLSQLREMAREWGIAA